MREPFKKSKIFVWILDLVLIGALILSYGFERFEEYRSYAVLALPLLVLLLIGVNLYLHKTSYKSQTAHKVSRINLLFLSGLLILQVVFVLMDDNDNSLLESYAKYRLILEYGLFIYFFLRLTSLVRRIYSWYFNPPLLFVMSFALISLTGAFLLMLPTATTGGISFTDALFTSTSAVAVTGLTVLDTAKGFTVFGQTVILALIQIGGLGMLTFTSFFAYFFKTGSTFRESLYMKDIIGEGSLNNIMKVTMQIVLFALLIELAGALLVFHSLNRTTYEGDFFFAVFHAISAFCNAGFVLAPNNLMADGLRFNYYLQWILMILIVFGGLGYTIGSNFLQYIKKYIFNLFHRNNKKFISRVITLNTKIVIITTVILIFGGTSFLLITDQQSVLAIHDTAFGKFTTAIFSSITTRTAGFNTVDFASISIPGILVVILLMWIGASPGSTGGGIKTTTFAIATLNVFSFARGKPNIEIGTRRIPKAVVQKAFGTIVISLIAIGMGITSILFFDPSFSPLEVAFEVFSAYSTVGLSLGITMELSTESKYIVILLMLFGRIGIMNLLMGILENRKTSQYAYPKENIIIT